ncbi:MAG: elongation factor P [Myxococcales bacterium]|nr:elongation factor P [Myxococcales bacterium]MCB9531615.1 elongation factor P [Myxococcales bacterium]MCB9532734.1 elongation factor P [Myxococcales bacterium]
MYDTSQFRKNLKIEIDGEPWIVLTAQHVKPGKGVAIVKTRMRNLITGRVLERNFRSGDKVGVPNLQQREVQYLYNDGSAWIFMDNSNYEQLSLPRDAVEEALPFLIDNLPVEILFYEGKAISVELPTFIEADLIDCPPAVKGDTAQGATKSATISTGYSLQVPLYMQEGERIRVDTRTGEFSERVK